MKNKQKIQKNVIALAAAITMLMPSGFAFASEITPENVLFLINRERVYFGLNPLNPDPDLNRAAGFKSKDMISRDYFDHYGYGLTPWDFIGNQDYNYLYAGENLAMDFETAEGVVSAWLVSPTHRANILSPDFEDTGIGVVKGEFTENGLAKETTVVTNMFGRKKPPVVEVFNQIIENIRYLFGGR